MTLTEQYARLKTRVGGNREVQGYEETFGQPREEAMRITPPAPINRRILAELDFAIRLSASNNGKYDPIIRAALDYLTAQIDENDVLTRSACMKAEEILLPLSKAAKEYKLILAGHAHIDMNWMWAWHETVAATLATFRTMLTIMNEYPDFCFSQSQSVVYKIVEDFEPEMMDEIKARIQEGRWEVTSSAWVETDKNMPSTESLIRHIKYSKNYLHNTWGIDPDSLEVDFSPDTFGHSANLPEIDLAGGVKYYYHCRGLDGKQALYRWRGPSGKELLCYREQHWYNSGITPKIGIAAIDISERSGGLKTGLIVYGVGDHGGGPTRRDIENAIDMMSWPIFPTIKFGTFREYFHEAESVRDQLPLVEHELNLLFTGCYTTQSRLKLANRQCEAAFSDAETLSALSATALGSPFHGDRLERAYRDVLFTHFHDILTGSCVQDSREHSMGLFSNSIAVANHEYLLAMNAISSATDTSMIVTEDNKTSQAEGAGAGYGLENFSGKPVPEVGGGKVRIWTVFNPTAVKKNEPVEITVWDYPGDLRRLSLNDAIGNPLEFQLLNFRPETYWDHKFFRILVNVDVAPFGYTTIVLSEKEYEGSYPLYLQGDNRTQKPYHNIVLDNRLIRAEFDFRNGYLVSLKSLSDGIEYIRPGDSAGLRLVTTEARSSNAWNIGRYLKETPITDITEVSSFGGHLRQGVRVSGKVLNSTFTAEITLLKGASTLNVSLTVDWNEVGRTTVPVLVWAIPLAYQPEDYLYDIPAGTLRRSPQEQDAPGNSFAIALSGSDRSAGIVSACKYGYRGRPDGTLISTLINTATSPDKYPERGIHKIDFHVGIFDSAPKAMKERAESLLHPLTYASTTSHKGALSPEGNFFDWEASGAVISAVSRSDDGKGLLIRLVSLAQAESNFSFTFKDAPSSAICVDYLDRPVEGILSIDGNTLSGKIDSATIKTIKIEW